MAFAPEAVVDGSGGKDFTAPGKNDVYRIDGPLAIDANITSSPSPCSPQSRIVLPAWSSPAHHGWENGRAAPGCHLARMTGSGATCFGIFDDLAAAEAAAPAVAQDGWWVAPTELDTGTI